MAKKTPEEIIYKKGNESDFVHAKPITNARLDPTGRERVSSIPLAPPVGYIRQPSLAQQIRDMVRSEQLAAEARNAGYETFEEADDFEVDDFDPSSPYEEVFEPELPRSPESQPKPEPVGSDPAKPDIPPSSTNDNAKPGAKGGTE